MTADAISPARTAPDYGSPAFAAWRAAAPDWEAYTRHRFVEGLGDGSLPREAFLHYLVQDFVFLVHFSRAWAMAAVKAETVDEIRACAATVNALIGHEIELHIKVCGEAGISRDALEAAAERPENMAYTRYVIEAGVQGDFLDILAALAPCVLGYGEIGLRLKAEATSDAYGEWIATYAGEAFQGACHEVGGLIETALARRLGPDPAASPRWPRLLDRFAAATRLEVGFWEMNFAPDAVAPTA